MMEIKEIEKIHQGEWVLLFHDEIIDHSANVEDILRIVDEKFPEDTDSSNAIRIAKILNGTPRDNLFER
jgi:hypothetical protein